MKYVKIKKICVTAIVLFVTAVINAQTESISIVQYTASFAQEISLKKFKEHNIYTFNIIEKKEVFDEEKIKFLPTIVLYHNGEEVLRVESGITLKLPEDTLELLEEKIDEIIESKF